MPSENIALATVALRWDSVDMLLRVWQAGRMKKQASDQSFHDRKYQERKRAEAAKKVVAKKVVRDEAGREGSAAK